MSHKPQVKGLELRMLVFKRGASKRKLTLPVAIIFVETLNTTHYTTYLSWYMYALLKV